jgi:hypothetical protein
MWRLERRGNGWQGVLALTCRYVAGLSACLIPVGLAFTAATFPGELLEDHIGNKQWIPPNIVTAWLGAKNEDDGPIWTSFHDLLFNGAVDDVTQRRNSPFSNTLVLPGLDVLEAAKIDDSKKLDSVKQTRSLRGRHLENAVFDRADLRKADLKGAYLDGVSLDEAQLQGATLDSVHLQGAVLDRAQLQGGSLYEAELQGASLFRAELQGAELGSAQLQGATLLQARVHSASLDAAQLQGASLDSAQLQGVSLDNANFQGATLDGAYLWRTHFSLGYNDTTDIADAVQASAEGLVWKPQGLFFGYGDPKPWTKATYLAARNMIEDKVPAGERRETALRQIEVLIQIGPSKTQLR